MYLRESVFPSTPAWKIFKESRRAALKAVQAAFSWKLPGSRYTPDMKYMSLIVMCAACLCLSGCDEYEREKLENAADNIGDASSHAADRARTSTANGLQDLSDSIRPDGDSPEQSDADAEQD